AEAGIEYGKAILVLTAVGVTALGIEICPHRIAIGIEFQRDAHRITRPARDALQHPGDGSRHSGIAHPARVGAECGASAQAAATCCYREILKATADRRAVIAEIPNEL